VYIILPPKCVYIILPPKCVYIIPPPKCVYHSTLTYYLDCIVLTH
jgi:hypothetical protein